MAVDKSEPKKRKRHKAADDAEEDNPKKKKTKKTEKKKKKRSDEMTTTAQPEMTTTTAGDRKRQFYKEHDIRTETEVEPMLEFAEAPFGVDCRRALTMAGYTSPTPTQSVSWPLVLGAYDVLSVAKTGSGKTLGFLLPVLHKLALSEKKIIRGPCSPRCLVLAPTRELATQIGVEASKFAPVFDCRSATVYGGAPKWEQAKKLKTLGGRAVVVGTPGRVNDFLETSKLSLVHLETLVLDEADRMLDMGFEPQIRSIVNYDENPQRQTLFFSATWDPTIHRVATALMRQSSDFFAKVVFGDAADGTLVANKDISQDVMVLPPGVDKPGKALNFVAGLTSFKKLMIFVATKRGADQLARLIMKKHGPTVAALHGDKEQAVRDATISQFRSGDITILVATDVAARGLDVPDVTHVLCYDFPSGSKGIEDFVHRIGRTGRAGHSGFATTFFTHDDAVHAKALVQILQDAAQPVPPDLLQLAHNFRKSSKTSSTRQPYHHRGRPASFGRGGRGRGGYQYSNNNGGSPHHNKPPQKPQGTHIRF